MPVAAFYFLLVLVLLLSGTCLFLRRQGKSYRSAAEKLMQTEEELRGSNELFSLFMRHSPIYAFIKEVSPGRSVVRQASENFEQMVGIPGSRMQGKSMEELFPADFAAKMTADDWAVVSAGRVLRLEEDLGEEHFNTIKFPIRQRGKTLLAGYTIDVTERRRVEEALQRSEEKFSKAFAACPEAITIEVLAEGKYIDVNEAFLKKSGFLREEVIGRTSMELGVWVDPADRSRYIETLAREGSLKDFAVDYRMKSGEVRSFLVSAEKIVLTGTPCSLNFVIDVTERKRAEEEATRRMEELAAWHQITLGREGRVLELKEEVNELLEKAGQPPRY